MNHNSKLYAEFRAECLKADIEEESKSKVRKKPLTKSRKEKKRDYQKKYREKHHDEILKRQREFDAKKKAAQLLAQSSGAKETT